MPEKVEAGSPIHGPLQRFEPVDVPFDWARAPAFSKRGLDREAIPFQPARKAAKQAISRLIEPSFESACRFSLRMTRSQHGRERQGQLARANQIKG